MYNQEIENLTNQIHDLSKNKVQSLIHRVNKKDDIASYPFFTGLEQRKTIEWLRFIGQESRDDVREMIERIK